MKKRAPLRFGPTLTLRCPYCGITPLRREKSWFTFDAGCAPCDYRYEREPGYFNGASQMISFTVISLTAFVLGALLLWRFPEMDALVIAGVVAVFCIAFGFGFFPYGQAFWIYLDHRLHPLDDADRYAARPGGAR